MEVVEFSVVEPGRRLSNLVHCLVERMGMHVTGRGAGVRDFAVDDVVQIAGERPAVLRRLEDCDPGWREYLSE